MNTFETCPKWAREGHCTKSPKLMMLHCRESCGTCGFKSGKKLNFNYSLNLECYLVFTHLNIILVFNRELQKDGSKQYTDLDSPDFGN